MPRRRSRSAAPEHAQDPNAERMAFGSRFARQLWDLLRVYWTSADAKRGTLLLVLTIALELATVWGNLLVADAERRILDALADRQSVAFVAAITLFLGITMGFVVVATYRIYVRQALDIRWRRVLTRHYIDRWITGEAYIQPELCRGAIDNPDQRIQEDVRDFVTSALGLSLSLLAAVASLVVFGGLLWNLSAGFPLRVGAMDLRVPGIMLWVAIGYGLLSMWITHLVGRPLIPISFDRLRFEADFRYGLTRFRDNAEAVALTRGETVERHAAHHRFHNVLINWWQLVGAQRNLALVTGAVGQANSIVPILIAVPAYFAGTITLGAIAQIRIAYGQVSGALGWFVFAYQEIARWRANTERIVTFSEAMDRTGQRLAGGGIRVVRGATEALHLEDLRIEEPDGRVLLDHGSAAVAAGDRIAITGASGTGKTLLMRAIAGIWPFGAGRIEVPRRARVLFVTQWPYVPVGTLRAAASYPAPEGAFSDDRISEVLRLLGLERLHDRIADVAQWDQLLSPHEQQRLSLVRVLLHEPDWLFLDKATSALDEETERYAYGLLAERLPDATVLTIAHRPAVTAYHHRCWNLIRTDASVVLEDTRELRS